MEKSVDHCKEREWKLRSFDGTLSDNSVHALETESGLIPLIQETGLSPMTIQVCLNRGLKTAQEIQDFVSPRLERLKDPFTIKDMSIAVDRLELARETGEPVRIFGDYDVDGTTGAALLAWIFKEYGITADVRQPDRFKDGYGLNVTAVDETAEAGIQLLVTVDCGISSFAAADKAEELGIDLIVVDHHQIDPEKGLPPALAVVNPQRSDCESGLRQLCGCGLAFYLARALRTRGRDRGWWPVGKEPNLKQHLDLVVMATAADMVPLTGDNHILVRQGLEVLKNSRKPGVKALLEAAGLLDADQSAKKLSPSHLGFTLGPRINASGRMASANLALELLTTTDAVAAASMAQELERLNKERAEVQNQIWDQVRVRVEEGIAAGKFNHGIVVADASWHEGVVGIVASRVTETFRRPAAVLTLREDHGKGSVRSYGGKDVLEALRASSVFLKAFGGHRYAAGLSLELDQVDAFTEAFDQALGAIEEDSKMKALYVEGVCELNDLNLKTLGELENLGPFGPGNPEPVFKVRAQVLDHQVLKGRHLKLRLGAAQSSHSVEAIWFNAAERSTFSDDEEKFMDGVEWAAVPEINRFRGRETPTLRIKDWRDV